MGEYLGVMTPYGDPEHNQDRYQVKVEVVGPDNTHGYAARVKYLVEAYCLISSLPDFCLGFEDWIYSSASELLSDLQDNYGYTPSSRKE